VTGRTAESISHYQSVVLDDSDGISKVVTGAVIIDCGIIFCVVYGEDAVYC